MTSGNINVFSIFSALLALAMLSCAHADMDKYQAQINKSFPGFQIMQRHEFWDAIHRLEPKINPALAVGRFNPDPVEDFAAFIRSTVKKHDEVFSRDYYDGKVVVCHSLEKLEKQEYACVVLDEMPIRVPYIFYLRTVPPGKAECIKDEHQKREYLDVRTDSIGWSTGLGNVAGWYVYQPDGSYFDCTTTGFLSVILPYAHADMDKYQAQINKSFPGFQIMQRHEFTADIEQKLKINPALATGYFNQDKIEDFAASIRSTVKKRDKVFTRDYYDSKLVVCHGLGKGGYSCLELERGGQLSQPSRFYLHTVPPGKAQCLKYEHDFEDIDVKTDSIGRDTDIAAGQYIYQPDGSYFDCTTAD